jgi:hypothetical protein
MNDIAAAIASKFPDCALWPSTTEMASEAPVDSLPTAGEDIDLAEASGEASADLAELIKRHDDVVAAEQQSFNHRLTDLLNTRRELPANDRRRLNALLAELLEHRDEIAAPAQEVAAAPAQDVAAAPTHDVAAAPVEGEDLAAPVNDKDDVSATLTAAFDEAVGGIVKSLNEHFATNAKSSIVGADAR